MKQASNRLLFASFFMRGVLFLGVYRQNNKYVIKNRIKNLAELKKCIIFALAFEHEACLLDKGEMVEWSITTVLKTVVLRGTGGSNPSLSAKASNGGIQRRSQKAYKAP